jgi:hypothetical protein
MAEAAEDVQEQQDRKGKKRYAMEDGEYEENDSDKKGKMGASDEDAGERFGGRMDGKGKKPKGKGHGMRT